MGTMRTRHTEPASGTPARGMGSFAPKEGFSILDEMLVWCTALAPLSVLTASSWWVLVLISSLWLVVMGIILFRRRALPFSKMVTLPSMVASLAVVVAIFGLLQVGWPSSRMIMVVQAILAGTAAGVAIGLVTLLRWGNLSPRLAWATWAAWGGWLAASLAVLATTLPWQGAAQALLPSEALCVLCLLASPWLLRRAAPGGWRPFGMGMAVAVLGMGSLYFVPGAQAIIHSRRAWMPTAAVVPVVVMIAAWSIWLTYPVHHELAVAPSHRPRHGRVWFTSWGWTLVLSGLAWTVIGRLAANGAIMTLGGAVMAATLLVAWDLQRVVDRLQVALPDQVLVPAGESAAVVCSAWSPGAHWPCRIRALWAAGMPSPWLRWRAPSTAISLLAALPIRPRGRHASPGLRLEVVDGLGWVRAWRSWPEMSTVPQWVHPQPDTGTCPAPADGHLQDDADPTLLHRHRPEEGWRRVVWRLAAGRNEYWSRGGPVQAGHVIWADEAQQSGATREQRWRQMAGVITTAPDSAMIGMRWRSGEAWAPQAGRQHRAVLLRALAEAPGDAVEIAPGGAA